MPTNLTKIYNSHLDIIHLNEYERVISLRGIFDRDITNNPIFIFRAKIIRPLKIEGQSSIDVLFSHLTHQTEEEIDKNGKIIKKRSIFDFERSKRLHWIWHHIQERNKENIDIFSFEDRVKGRNVVRTYIYDFKEKYIIILEPQRSKLDYYLLSAYYLTEKLGGITQIEKKRKRKLPDIY